MPARENLVIASAGGLFGWGTWIRTKINGVRVRCSTVELSPNAAGAG